MKFIEIAAGMSVLVDSIEAIEQVVVEDSEVQSRVYSLGRVYNSTFPYMTLLSIINQHLEEKDQVEQKNAEALDTLKKSSQFYSV